MVLYADILFALNALVDYLLLLLSALTLNLRVALHHFIFFLDLLLGHHHIFFPFISIRIICCYYINKSLTNSTYYMYISIFFFSQY